MGYEIMRAVSPRDAFWDLLSDTDRARLSAHGRISVFRPGDTMCVEGDPQTHVFVLLSGWVKIRAVTSVGQGMVLALRGHGDIVGEVAGESTGYRIATVQAIDTVRSLIVAHDKFSSFLDSHPGADRAYRRVITQRWTDAAELLRNRWRTSGAQRLAGLLLDLADRRGAGNEHRIVIEMPLSQDEIASLIGASRATVTRALSDWRRRGLISTSQRHVTIVDVKVLRRIAGQ